MSFSRSRAPVRTEDGGPRIPPLPITDNSARVLRQALCETFNAGRRDRCWRSAQNGARGGARSREHRDSGSGSGAPAAARQQCERESLDAARSLGTERGVREVTPTDIAAAVGMHESAMLGYFGTREQIFPSRTAEGRRD
ncbi:helix-turn-helix domain-containing protein [Streptomyces sp. NPDC013157]|uniref:helix-turn-helix domain-containing protein n=1 Tax=Streptomyces sp. NPDC013157 TaxID=3364861 RepID=UPI0036ACDDA1